MSLVISGQHTEESLAQLPLIELIPLVDHWYLTVDTQGNILHLTPGMDHDVYLDKLFTLGDFAAIDDRFTEFVLTHRADGAVSIAGFDFHLALMSWDSQQLELPAGFMPEYSFAQHHGPTFTVRAIEPAYRTTAEGHTILQTVFYISRQMPSGKTYAWGCGNGLVELPAAWLEQHCPSWNKKLDLALAMDIPATELPGFVFGPDVRRHVAGPGSLTLPNDGGVSHG